jgi:acid phosphatase
VAAGALVALAVAAGGRDDGGGTTRTAAAPDATVRPAGPAAGPPVRFAALGDWGWGGPAQARVFAGLCRAHARAPLAFLLTTGDNFYRPDGRATAANHGRPARCVVRAGIPWRAAWGNHDLGGESTATVLGATRRWYTFARGPLRVVVLDANVPGDPAQLRFLRRTLATAREPVRVVALHQPLHTAGLHAPDDVARRRWGPVFRSGGVALVLQGHNHAYERLHADGLVYITTGGGGAPVYPCVRFPATLRRCHPVHHFLLLSADRRGVTLTAVRAAGGVIERVRVPARA